MNMNYGNHFSISNHSSLHQGTTPLEENITIGNTTFEQINRI